LLFVFPLQKAIVFSFACGALTVKILYPASKSKQTEGGNNAMKQSNIANTKIMRIAIISLVVIVLSVIVSVVALPVVSIITTLLAILILSFIIGGNSSNLSELRSLVHDVARGNLNVNMSKSNILNGDIGALTQDIYTVVETLKNIRNDFEVFSQNIVGDYEYRLDVSEYTGAYKDIMQAVNSAVDITEGEGWVMMEAIESVIQGNFDVQSKRLPGKRATVNEKTDEFLAQLKNVTNQIDLMIESTINGDLSFQVDTAKYNGDWATLMSGLNNIAKAVDVPLKVIDIAFEELKNGNFDLNIIDSKITEAGYNSDANLYKGVFSNIIANFEVAVADISSYIDELKQILAQMADGDLRNSIEREYVGSFDSIKRSVNNINETLHKTMSEISAASNQVLSGAKQIATSATDLANGASQQAASVEELNANIDMINNQTNQNATDATEANKLSDKSTVGAKDGNEAMRQMLEAMQQIKESSSSISSVNKVIQDIAFQTNLLALNAAVEAARAGEHGKGFAVVAEEVRNLAARSQEAAQQTTGLIEDSINRVDAGSSIAESTAQALEVIVNNASEVSQIITGIANSSREQAEAVGQASIGIGQISSVVQSNSAVSEETAAAAEELSSQSELLQKLVSYFKL